MRLERKLDHICKFHAHTISTSFLVGNGQENGTVRMPPAKRSVNEVCEREG